MFKIIHIWIQYQQQTVQIFKNFNIYMLSLICINQNFFCFLTISSCQEQPTVWYYHINFNAIQLFVFNVRGALHRVVSVCVSVEVGGGGVTNYHCFFITYSFKIFKIYINVKIICFKQCSIITYQYLHAN